MLGNHFHGYFFDWLILNVWPARVTLLERLFPPFTAIPNAADPDPDPLAPDVTVIQLALPVAVQGQPTAVTTVPSAVPP
jgi:hypothetical protein